MPVSTLPAFLSLSKFFKISLFCCSKLRTVARGLKSDIKKLLLLAADFPGYIFVLIPKALYCAFRLFGVISEAVTAFDPLFEVSSFRMDNQNY